MAMKSTLTVGDIQDALQKFSRKDSISRLWDEAATRNVLQEISRYSRRRASEQQKSGKSKSGRALIDMKRVREVAVPPAEILSQWSLEPTSFSTMKQQCAEDILPKNLRHAYEVTSALVDEDLSYIIRLRFFHHMFFEAGAALEPLKRNVNASSVEAVKKHLIALGAHGVDQERLKDWILVGSVYHVLMNEFGEGCLFFLPTEIGFKGWVHLAPAAQEVIARLDKIGIRNWIESSNANSIGRRISRSLLDSVKAQFQNESLSNSLVLVERQPNVAAVLPTETSNTQFPGASNGVVLTDPNSTLNLDSDWVAMAHLPPVWEFNSATSFQFMSAT